jgi:hypothetical protein
MLKRPIERSAVMSATQVARRTGEEVLARIAGTAALVVVAACSSGASNREPATGVGGTSASDLTHRPGTAGTSGAQHGGGSTSARAGSGSTSGGSGSTSGGSGSEGGTLTAGGANPAGGTAAGGVTTGVGGAGPLDSSGFPLSISANGHYLQTAKGGPFLVTEASSWGLIQTVSLAHAQDYIDKRLAQGFNSLKISVISADASRIGDYRSAPNWNGIGPFTTPGDFSTANPANFDHAADVLKYMQGKGMLVFLFANYFGYGGDGWREAMVADTDAHCYAYGQFLGNRFKGFSNFIWAAGGDYYPTSAEESRQAAVIDGIRSVDASHYWTAHWDNGNADGGRLSVDEAFLTKRMGTVVNGLYSWDPANPPHMYSRVRQAYAADYSALVGRATIPILILDEPYETEPQGSPLEMRTKSHRAMCEGACGIGFNAGPNWHHFVDWTTITQGTTEASYANMLWASLPWETMAPDVSNAYVTSGRGTFNTDNYVTALASPTALVAHFPNGAASSIVVAMSKFSKGLRARWWDPTANNYRLIAESIANTGTHSFANPGNNAAGNSDWLLILD